MISSRNHREGFWINPSRNHHQAVEGTFERKCMSVEKCGDHCGKEYRKTTKVKMRKRVRLKLKTRDKHLAGRLCEKLGVKPDPQTLWSLIQRGWRNGDWTLAFPPTQVNILKRGWRNGDWTLAFPPTQVNIF
ncbi:hypothetical protein TNCV_3703491 [Trichonephila clavipes]|nr:hypothetical protein TNCV_3703491 [Trichonephila clavipes]